MRFLTSLTGIVALFILFPTTAIAAPVGEFTHIEGRVDVTRPGLTAEPVHPGDKIYKGDIIRAKSNSKAEITFADGNIVSLAESTRIEINEYLAETEQTNGIIKLFRGKIRSKVKKVIGRLFGDGKDNRFEVHTPTSVCGVRGTDFFTYHQRGVSGFIFKEGTGYGYSMNRPDEIRTIVAGQTMVVTTPDLPPLVRPASEMEMKRLENDTGTPEKADKEGRQKEDGKGETAEKERREEEKGDREQGDSKEDRKDGVTDEEGESVAEKKGTKDEKNAQGKKREGRGAQNEGGQAAGADKEDKPDGRVEADAGAPAKGDRRAGRSGDMGGLGQDGITDQSAGSRMAEAGSRDSNGDMPRYDIPNGDRHNGDMGGGYMPGGDAGGDYGSAGRFIPIGDMGVRDMPSDFMPMGGMPFGEIPGGFFGGPLPGSDMFGPLTGRMPLANAGDNTLPNPDVLPNDVQKTVAGIIPPPSLLGTPIVTPDIPLTLRSGIPFFTSYQTEWAFDGDTYHLVSGTAYEGAYHRPDEFSSWPYDNYYAPYDGSRYEYFYFVNSETGNHLIGYQDLPGGIEHLYLSDKTKIIRERPPAENMAEISKWDSLPADISQPPTSAYKLLYAESYDSNSLEKSGWFRGDIYGMKNLLENPSSYSAAITLSGQFYTAYEPSIFAVQAKGMTPGGKAYIGPMGGLIDTSGYAADDLIGEIYAIYLDPRDSTAGIVHGSFSGSVHGTYLWDATGTVDREYLYHNVTNATAETLLSNLDHGGMILDQIHGGFGASGQNGSIGRAGQAGGMTSFIRGQDWGVFGLVHAFDNYFENPYSENSWSATLFGWGDFGRYLDNAGTWKWDHGVWIGDVYGGSFADNRLSGSLGGQILTLTKSGILEGKTLGTFNNTISPGTWQAVTLGRWEKSQILTFSNTFDGDLFSLWPQRAGYYSYGDGSYYTYSYDLEQNHGGTYFYDASSGNEKRGKYHTRGINRIVYLDQWVHDSTTEELLSFTSTPLGSGFAFSDLAGNPSNLSYTCHGSYDRYFLREFGDFDGIMGGTGDR